jgi:hypothetical protein
VIIDVNTLHYFSSIFEGKDIVQLPALIGGMSKIGIFS